MKIFQPIDQPDMIPIFYEKTGIKLNVLISYPYLGRSAEKLMRTYRHMINLLYCDSGGYSAHASGLKVTVWEWLRYLRAYGDEFDERFNLDDHFQDWERNLQNQLILERGLSDKPWRVVPVTHNTRDPFGEFSMYADMGHSFIAMGSNQRSIKDEVFQKIRDTYPQVKIHMFGNLNRKMLLQYRPYSADSTGYADEAKFGRINYWDPLENKAYRIRLGAREKPDINEFHFKTFNRRKEVEEFLKKTFGYSYYHLLTDVYARWFVNLYFYKQLEDYINANSR